MWLDCVIAASTLATMWALGMTLHKSYPYTTVVHLQFFGCLLSGSRNDPSNNINYVDINEAAMWETENLAEYMIIHYNFLLYILVLSIHAAL